MEPDGPTPPRPRRRRAIWIVLAALGVLLVACAVSTGLASAHLSAGRDALSRGKTALLAGDTLTAQREFVAASGDFDAAEGAAAAPWLRAVGLVPFAGRTPDALAALGEAGAQTASAGTAIADALDGLPGGLSSLAPTGGGIPVERIAALAGPVADAEARTGAALATLEASSSHLVTAPIADARADAIELVTDLHAQLEAGSTILRGLPAFLGDAGPRSYLFGAVNPAEIRGGGGLMGAYSILTVDHGRFRFGSFSPIQQLPILDVADVPGATKDYARNYAHYRQGQGFWLNANMTPDFPTSAATLAQAYETATGDHVDGVITADPFALQALLLSTGPTLIPGLDIRVSADDVVAFVTNEAYRRFDDPRIRKQVLGAVAASVVDRFLARPESNLGALKSLARTASEGHIKVWSADPELEAGLAVSGVGGGFDPPAGDDLLAVIQNNASATKLDFFQQRNIGYDVRLGADGTATAALEVALHNDAPTSGYPPYVIGPYPGLTSEPGENIAILQTYCGRGCGVTSATVDGEPIDTGLHVELGHPYLATYQRIAPGGTSTLHEELTLPAAWTGDRSGGTYRLRIVHQATIKPDVVRVQIAVPAGMQVTETSPELDSSGDVLVYQGSPTTDLELWARFRPALPLRLWRDLTQVFYRSN
jgi:hypothetical protein